MPCCNQGSEHLSYALQQKSVILRLALSRQPKDLHATSLYDVSLPTPMLTRIDQLRVPASALGDFFAPGHHCVYPFAAQLGLCPSF